MTPADTSIELLGQGKGWQELRVGQRFKTLRRTITEADLVNFIGVTGMLEVIFIDASYSGAISGRPVPGALTYTFIEGLILQTLIQSKGLAMLELHQKIHAPVRVGDTIAADIEVISITPTSKGDRAVVASGIEVTNQHGERVMSYTAVRLLAGVTERDEQ